MVGAQAIIGDIVPPRERGRYMGLIGSVFAVASVAGPLLGGFFVDNLSWRWVFYVNMPVGARRHRDRRHAAAPAHAARTATGSTTSAPALLSGGVGALILLTTWGGNEYAWGSATIVGLGVAGVALLAAFVWRETPRRRADPAAHALPLAASSASPARWASRSGWRCSARSSSSRSSCSSSTARARPAPGLRMLPLMAGLLVAVDRLRPRDQPDRPLQGLPDRRHGDPRRRHVPALAARRRHRRPGSPPSTCSSSASASASSCRCSSSSSRTTPGRRTIGVATSTATFFRSVGGAFGVAIFGAIFASRLSPTSSPHLPASVAAPPRQRRPPQPRSRRSTCRRRCTPSSCTPSPTSLHGVFLWGMAIAVVPFALSWLLKEVPLRTTLHRSAELSAEQATAGGATAEAIVEPYAPANPAG